MKQLLNFFSIYSNYTWIYELTVPGEMADNLLDLFSQEQSEIRKFALAIPFEKGVKYDSDNRGLLLLRAGLVGVNKFNGRGSANYLKAHNIRQRMLRNITQYADQGRIILFHPASK